MREVVKTSDQPGNEEKPSQQGKRHQHRGEAGFFRDNANGILRFKTNQGNTGCHKFRHS